MSSKEFLLLCRWLLYIIIFFEWLKQRNSDKDYALGAWLTFGRFCNSECEACSDGFPCGFYPAFRSANTLTSSLPAAEIWLAFWSAEFFFKNGFGPDYCCSGVNFLGWVNGFLVSPKSAIRLVRSFLNYSLNPTGAIGVMMRLPRTFEDIWASGCLSGGSYPRKTSLVSLFSMNLLTFWANSGYLSYSQSLMQILRLWLKCNMSM